MLVEIHLSRKQKEELRIKALLSSQKILKAPCPPKADNKLSLLQVKAMVPNFCFDPGFPLLSVPNLAGKLACVHLPGSSRTSSQALAAIKWYWSSLSRWTLSIGGHLGWSFSLISPAPLIAGSLDPLTRCEPIWMTLRVPSAP